MIARDKMFLNRILAGITLVVSFFVYLSTMAKTVPYWDCGEFIATSYILGVPHPPGSPLYLILGRIFSLLPFNTDIAYRVNLMSPITSSIAVMMVYLIIVKVVAHYRGTIQSSQDAWIAFGGAFVGAMTFAFTDSHWFNAVEAEVYAISTFFTAIVVWLILHWSDRADEPGNERYILIIAYMFGLAIGVHILNLLTLPFIALIIYFRKMQFAWKTFFITTAITFLIFLVIHNGIIKGLPHLAGSFLGLSGVFALILIITGAAVWSIMKKHQLLSLALSSMVLILVGYSSYALIFIRSAQNPAIDENNPETIKAAIAYLEREQYGAIGQFPRRFDKLPPKHEVVGRPAAGNQYSASQTRKYMFYNWDKQWNFFWNYQIRKMYNRYFLWQFAGRGPSIGQYTSALGADAKEDGVFWLQFGLPLALLLGMVGLVFHFRRDWSSGFSFFTLFFVTGWLLILYLNQDNPQPRERDYSYVGSFMAFAIWIGVGSAAIGEWISRLIKNISLANKSIVAALVLQSVLIPGIMLKVNYKEHDRTGNYVAWDYSYNLLQSCEPNGILFTNGDNDTFPLWYLQEVEGVRKDVSVANLSLLNTPWYVRQLRDSRPTDSDYMTLMQEKEGDKIIGRRFIRINDARIDGITSGLTRWEKRSVTLPVNSDQQITWTVKPTFAGQALKVQDMMVMQIINDANWISPIYFAVTVSPSNRIGLEDYLEMEGLAYRLRPYKTKAINPESMERHLITALGPETWNQNMVGAEWEKQESALWYRGPHDPYLFRNLGNEEVFYDAQIIRLLQNYRSAYMQLAVHHFMEFQKAESLKNTDLVEKHRHETELVLNTMSQNLPEKTISMDNRDLYYQIGRLYNGIGNAEEYKTILADLMVRTDNSVRDQLEYAQSFMELDDYDASLNILKKLYDGYKGLESQIQTGGKKSKDTEKLWNEYRRNYADIVSHLIITYRKLEKNEEAKSLLDSWLEQNPNDNEAKRLLKEMEG